MEVVSSTEAQEDLAHWKKTNNVVILKKLRALIESITENPYAGIGKPELLKHNLAGCWSRRINQEHRIVYEIIGDVIHILSLKGHY
ncbi:MAG: Txe/YoeB family addiction module toxin [Dyadobacter sp.]|uniref:Txe/YoeB family addiction module toxin n=1 Tax=Dyadobacter sp. TaxID=1914288 RepID=UPI001B186A7B|nr:Txe/YoeB family addiction module toxin [Dyadobacter sp.]MBO9612197.1 Txe/YoeB family addiction module toxin [Dyadobacter sp.]